MDEAKIFASHLTDQHGHYYSKNDLALGGADVEILNYQGILAFIACIALFT